MDLANVPTADIITELTKRDGIYVYAVGEGEAYRISVHRQKKTEILEMYEGSAKIITVVD